MLSFNQYLTEKKKKKPCWDGYKQVGMKMKNGKEVPNCVPINEDVLEEKTKVPQDKDVESKKGTQPKKYFKGLSKSTKEKRDAFWKENRKKADDDPSAYDKDKVPGNSKKTRPSKYTIAYKKRFGEATEEFDVDPNDKLKPVPTVEQIAKKHNVSVEEVEKQIKKGTDIEKEHTEDTDTAKQIAHAHVDEALDYYEKLADCVEEEVLVENKDATLAKKAKESGISKGILSQVYNRGMAAWKGGHRPGAGPHQWAVARVNSFITGGKTRTTADADLWKKHSSRKKKK